MADVSGISVEGLTRLEHKAAALLRGIESPDRSLFVEVGEFMRFRIQARTAEGKDVDGKDFEPYSDAYKAYRTKTGHPSDKVNLFFTGSMLSSMDFEVSRKRVDLFFQNTSDPDGVSNPMKAFFLNENRTFFSLSDDDVKGIMAIINRYYEKLIRQ